MHRRTFYGFTNYLLNYLLFLVLVYLQHFSVTTKAWSNFPRMLHSMDTPITLTFTSISSTKLLPQVISQCSTVPRTTWSLTSSPNHSLVWSIRNFMLSSMSSNLVFTSRGCVDILRYCTAYSCWLSQLQYLLLPVTPIYNTMVVMSCPISKSYIWDLIYLIVVHLLSLFYSFFYLHIVVLVILF